LNDTFTGCQPQYPDLQWNFNIDSKWLHAVFDTTRHLPDLTRHAYPAHSVIEEIVEGFVEGFQDEVISFRSMLANQKVIGID
jgi:hypothetical protein